MVNLRKPRFLLRQIAGGGDFSKTEAAIGNLHTICYEAKCPNRCECFSKKQATFLLLGDICTRSCRYCNVKSGVPNKIDGREAKKIALCVKELGLVYVVLTSVTRDDLKDGGARTFIDTMKEIKKLMPNAKIEILTPMLIDQIKWILPHKPDVFAHNLETVKELFDKIRPKTSYAESIRFLKQIKDYNPRQITKSGFMVGVGETHNQIVNLLHDLKNARVDIVTIGQYLQPSEELLGVERFYTPFDFKQLARTAKLIGIKKVISGPFVRSSYHAKDILESIES